MLGQKLRIARKFHRPALTQADLAQRLGVSRALIAMIEGGDREPTRDLLTKTAAALKFPLEWFDEETTNPPQYREDLLSSPMFTVPKATIEMKYAGQVPTSEEWGDPLSSETPIEVDAKFFHTKRYAARVVGDSCWPALQQGDLTIWHEDFNPPYGVIVLAQRKGDHGCTVKQLAYDSTEGRPFLKPVNPKYNSPDDCEGWGAIARLVGVTRIIDGLEQTWLLESGLRPRHLLPGAADDY